MPQEVTNAQDGTATCLDDLGVTEGCPLTPILDFLSARWTLPVLYALHHQEGPVRFGELRRAVGRVSQKELTRTLRDFELRGLVTREIFAEVPPRVEYRSTPLACTLRTPIEGIVAWAREHGAGVIRPG